MISELILSSFLLSVLLIFRKQFTNNHDRCANRLLVTHGTRVLTLLCKHFTSRKSSKSPVLCHHSQDKNDTVSNYAINVTFSPFNKMKVCRQTNKLDALIYVGPNLEKSILGHRCVFLTKINTPRPVNLARF